MYVIAFFSFVCWEKCEVSFWQWECQTAELFNYSHITPMFCTVSSAFNSAHSFFSFML